MQVFVNLSSRGCFYSEELCPSTFTSWLELRWAPFLPCLQLLPGTGSIQILSYTLQRWPLVPIRDQSLVAHPSLELVHTSYVWGPVNDLSQSLFLPMALHTHPFAAPTSVRYPRRSTLLVVADLGILVLDNELPPPVILCAMVISDLRNLPPLLPQSIIDHQNRCIIRGIPPIPKLRAGRQLLWKCTSVDMQEGKDIADPSIPFQILWLTVFYGTRIIGDIGY
jgi:hypothetical protein